MRRDCWKDREVEEDAAKRWMSLPFISSSLSIPPHAPSPLRLSSWPTSIHPPVMSLPPYALLLSLFFVFPLFFNLSGSLPDNASLCWVNYKVCFHSSFPGLSWSICHPPAYYITVSCTPVFIRQIIPSLPLCVFTDLFKLNPEHAAIIWFDPYLNPSLLYSTSFCFLSLSLRAGTAPQEQLRRESELYNMLSLFNTAWHQQGCYRGFSLEPFHFKYSCDHASCSDPLC